MDRVLALVSCLTFAHPVFAAQPEVSETEVEEKDVFSEKTRRRRDRELWNAQGTTRVAGHFGFGSNGYAEDSFFLGAGVGYAVLTGVMPGARGQLIFGNGLGEEIAVNLTLTPPFVLPITPFAIGEFGRRWDAGFEGWLYGGGGGFFVGKPSSSFALQVGWMVRRFDIKNVGKFDTNGPILATTVRF